MENQNSDLKNLVKSKYGQIADQDKTFNLTSCCGCGTDCGSTYTVMADDYSHLEGYIADADLGLGCGLPTEYAQIKEGDTVLDLGSGAGNDCFVARAIVGETGRVIGIDFTEKMIEKARQNAQKLGFKNVEFIKSDIENMPLPQEFVDVVVSNCVLNLVPNKENVFRETYRVLKKGGHFSISDIVLIGNLPVALQKEVEMYAGCVSGAIQKDEYLLIIEKVGFKNIKIQKQKKIFLPDSILLQYLSQEEIEQFRDSKVDILSITVYAEK